MRPREQFLRHLRYALNHLYDPDRLRDNPLAISLGIAGQPNTPSELRRILTEAIESLKPEVDLPSQSRAWRIYELLFYRYVQQFGQQEVADQLGLSVRHLRREQRVALRELACRLWEQFHPANALGEEAGAGNSSLPVETASPALNQELAWVKDHPLEKPAALDQILPSVLSLVRPLVTQHRVDLGVTMADSLPELAVHPVALRQILLNLLITTICRASEGCVRVLVRPLGWEIEVQVVCISSRSDLKPTSDDDRARMDMAHQLTSLCGGRLTSFSAEGTFVITLILPVVERLPVLVIDDNADTLQLLQRYASRTRYRIIGTRDPERALDLAKQVAPQIIVLDVMMPQVDGWEVLGRLKHHPLTSHIPIIVCTILAQEELALSLGASAFVRKPVTRQAFLAALDCQAAEREIKPR